jgi:hypothetical protein
MQELFVQVYLCQFVVSVSFLFFENCLGNSIAHRIQSSHVSLVLVKSKYWSYSVAVCLAPWSFASVVYALWMSASYISDIVYWFLVLLELPAIHKCMIMVYSKWKSTRLKIPINIGRQTQNQDLTLTKSGFQETPCLRPRKQGITKSKPPATLLVGVLGLYL